MDGTNNTRITWVRWGGGGGGVGLGGGLHQILCMDRSLEYMNDYRCLYGVVEWTQVMGSF